MHRIVLIDNFDSFTYNLVDYFKQAGADVTVLTNTASITEIQQFQPQLLVYSPGPGNPSQAGNLLAYIKYFSEKNLPQFGVCLGMQAMIESFGGTLQVLPEPKHGKTSLIDCMPGKVFRDLPKRFEVGRYHSLAAQIVPECFTVVATTIDDNTVMAIEHNTLLISGVQFHPESILTNPEIGLRIIKNVLR